MIHKLSVVFFIIPILLAPHFAFAQSVSGPLGNTLVQAIAVINALIPVLLALAVLLFLWGIVKFIANAGDEAARGAGIRHMIWGMIALFVMVAFWSIIGYVQQSLGITGTVTPGNAPSDISPVPSANIP